VTFHGLEAPPPTLLVEGARLLDAATSGWVAVLLRLAGLKVIRRRGLLHSVLLRCRFLGQPFREHRGTIIGMNEK